MNRRTLAAIPLAIAATVAIGASSSSGAAGPAPFLASLKSVSTIGTTVPANGDVNPYGIVRLSHSAGNEHAGDILISNFNDKANRQGTGTTIVEVTPDGKPSVFAKIDAKRLPGPCPGGVGLTTALSVLPGGYVVVGSLPTANGKSATARAGCLIVLDSRGKPVSTIAGPQIQGPWDMTAATNGSMTTLFVSNALNGGARKGLHTVRNSTVLRIRVRSGAGRAPTVLSQTVIGDGFPRRDDPAALVIGPTGVGLAPNGTLYVADTLSSRIAAIPQAMTRMTAAHHGGATVSVGGSLNQPLGLIIAPNGDVVTANAADGNMVETTPAGEQVVTRTADKKTGAGSLFGLVLARGGTGVYFVDDGDNTLKLLH